MPTTKVYKPTDRQAIMAEEIISAMEAMKDDRQRAILCRFFKTGKGQYGEGDQFLGLKVPLTRLVVKEARLRVGMDEIEQLIYSPWHEVRLAGFLLLVEEMNASLPRRGADSPESAIRRREIAGFYLRHAHQANNWDLVDLSAPYIIGRWLLHPDENGDMPDRHILDLLTASDNLWLQRIGIVATLALIREGQSGDTLRIVSSLLYHRHDLIHKAMGWMLREVGKKDVAELLDFLDAYYTKMPRTTLRYAIERLPEPQRQYWLRRK